ncbi:MAG: hypothetical protein ABJA34_07175 [Pseudonocardiales bacterium]
MRFEVLPDRLIAASGQVRCLAKALTNAGRDVAAALEDARAAVRGPQSAAAVIEVATAAALALGALTAGVDALAAALAAAAPRYAEADVMRGQP